MNKKGGVDQLIWQMNAALGERWRATYDHFMERGQWTPIEVLFYTAFNIYAELIARDETPLAVPPKVATLKEATAMLDGPIGPSGMIYIFPQCQLPGWRVDFLIGIARRGPAAWLIVECDGHDYHERTKEQAARDRSRDRKWQNADFGVFRFTGHELHADPMGRAKEVHDWLTRRHAEETWQ